MPRRGAALLVACAWLSVTTIGLAELPRTGHPTYERTAEWINANTPPDASVAAMDIGLVGFRIGERRVVDMCSLVHAEGAAEIAAGRSDWWLDRQPDYVVLHRPPREYFEKPAFEREDFAAQYTAVADPYIGIRISGRRYPATPK